MKAWYSLSVDTEFSYGGKCDLEQSAARQAESMGRGYRVAECKYKVMRIAPCGVLKPLTNVFPEQSRTNQPYVDLPLHRGIA
jgi:hypothetical protein